MSKEIAIDVLKSGIRTLKDLADPRTLDDPEDRAHSEVIFGIRLLCEALAMALDDSTKAHASTAFDKAYKCMFDITQKSSKPGYGNVAYVAGGLMNLTGAMIWLYFSRPPARPWKP